MYGPRSTAFASCRARLCLRLLALDVRRLGDGRTGDPGTGIGCPGGCRGARPPGRRPDRPAAGGGRGLGALAGPAGGADDRRAGGLRRPPGPRPRRQLDLCAVRRRGRRRQGIDLVIRGRDLLHATAGPDPARRGCWVVTTPASFLHHPLVPARVRRASCPRPTRTPRSARCSTRDERPRSCWGWRCGSPGSGRTQCRSSRRPSRACSGKGAGPGRGPCPAGHGGRSSVGWCVGQRPRVPDLGRTGIGQDPARELDPLAGSPNDLRGGQRRVHVRLVRRPEVDARNACLDER